MFKFLERLRQKKTETVSKSQHEWKRLVLATADEKHGDEVETLRTLERLGKSIDDLEEAVKAVRKRRELRAKLKTAREAEVEMKKVEQKIQREEDAFAPIQQKHDDTIATLSNQHGYFRSLQNGAYSIVEDLIRTSADLEARADYEAKRQADLELGQAVSELLVKEAEQSKVVGIHQTNLDRVSIHDTEQRPRLQTTLDNVTGELNAIRRQLADTRERQKIAGPAVREARAKLAETDM